MTDFSDFHPIELPTTPVSSFAVRRTDDDLDAFVEAIIRLMDNEAAVIDLPHRDRHADIIELRVASPARRSTP